MARKRYQQGCVILRGDVWYGKYRDDVVGQDGTVRRVQRRTPLGTKKEYPTKRLAERKLELLLHRINAPEYRPGRVATLAEFADRWEYEILSKRKPSTKEAAKSHLDVHIIPYMGKLRLDEIGVENQQVFVTRLAAKVSPKTLVNVLGTLSSMMNTAKNWGYICDGVSLNRLALPERGIKKEVRCFTADEVRRILQVATEPWRTMFAIAALLGLRAGKFLASGQRILTRERAHSRSLKLLGTARFRARRVKGAKQLSPYRMLCASYCSRAWASRDCCS
jgi:hypothetical protein